MYVLLILTTIQLNNSTINYWLYWPCPQWDTNPPPQYMSWPRITSDSRRLNPLGHHDQDLELGALIRASLFQRAYVVVCVISVLANSQVQGYL